MRLKNIFQAFLPTNVKAHLAFAQTHAKAKMREELSLSPPTRKLFSHPIFLAFKCGLKSEIHQNWSYKERRPVTSVWQKRQETLRFIVFYVNC